ncbi:apoptosis-stimulating of p53 protein 2-like [Lepus europaeus]|uniref:apoptosis-stimulating of p53 protein 2-like n=1 Tax=Lepus europaeus TaxID=9983 RepID=UPI002B49F1BD|nr:apoptosis-stimulating of p53 protein 2-like [Lepus europaeus]
MTYSDLQTAADKCEEMEEGYTQCSQFLYGVQEKMGIMNKGVIYALWDYEPQNDDELAHERRRLHDGRPPGRRGRDRVVVGTPQRQGGLCAAQLAGAVPKN